MFDVFFDKANELNARGQPFVMAIVVRSEPPISGKPGDKAIIEADGSIFGWIGGGCTQPVIVKEAKKALKDGKPRLVRITPERTVAQNGVEEYAMTCLSGGTLDIYLEPVMAKPQLVILGKSVVAQTLARLGNVLNYHVVVIAPDATPALFPDVEALYTQIDLRPLTLTPQTSVVVSTQGEHDEAALAEVLQHDLPYLAFVASKKKAEQVFQQLKANGTPPEHLERIKVPAGLDIKARTSEEIAVSILAEIIHVMRSSMPAEPSTTTATLQHVETLQIGEMSCQHCVHTVQTTLEAIEGVAVHEVEVGSAAISYDPSEVDRGQIVSAIENRGYRVLSEG